MIHLKYFLQKYDFCILCGNTFMLIVFLLLILFNMYEL